MSFAPVPDPVSGDAHQCDAIQHVIVPRSTDLGGFTVRRALPSSQARMVGPFIFLDHFGPAVFKSGEGLDVRPHPHIGLATLTYLFDGEIIHRDTLGTTVAIHPGEVNWMTAGRGIAHSERTAPERRHGGEPIHGLQCWVGLPKDREERDPAFAHYEAGQFRDVAGPGARARIVVGSLFGTTAPVVTETDTLFVDVQLDAGQSLPIDADHEERGLLLLSGEIELQGDRFSESRLLVFRPGDKLTVRAVSDARFMIIGGAALDGPRHIWWNFVSSRKERIEEAKQDWKMGRFNIVPGDETEFIPLPE